MLLKVQWQFGQVWEFSSHHLLHNIGRQFAKVVVAGEQLHHLDNVFGHHFSYVEIRDLAFPIRSSSDRGMLRIILL